MQAKYHAGIVPGWDDALRRIKKRVQAFIWKGGIPKVAKHTLRLPKKEGGLSVWSLVDKANAFSTMWVVKLLQNRTNPILETTIAAAIAHYQKIKGTDVPLWESRLDHSHLEFFDSAGPFGNLKVVESPYHGFK